ncbi:MAG: glycoside hydrolase family 16 protein [Fibrobacter sp.]|nr:glycoside hydrolase family 16 protein [Fibrobacter sp.]
MNNSFFAFSFIIAGFLFFGTLTSCSDDATSAPENNISESISSQAEQSSAENTPASVSSCSADEQTSSSDAKPVSSVADFISSQAVQSSAEISSADIVASSSSAGSDSASSDATSSSIAASSSSASGDTELNPKPFWNDEFEGTSLDESKWGYNIGTGDNGWGNGEWEYYTDRAENVYVKDGLLHIRASLETNADDIANKFDGQKYTSARIITQNKFTFAYGTVEARIALPAGKGIWPAFWMLGENIDKVSWPACGEIDIIEAINDENVIYGTHHWAHEGTHAQYGNSTKQHFDGHYDLDITEFHVYKMTWDKNAISMYVDDFMYQKIDIADAAGEMGTFHKPFFFILNVAVGGSWPGFDIDDAQFPTEMQVDYIRVYK